MGNRAERSMEVALSLLTEQIRTAWATGAKIATVFSLDISGAFDIVNHQRLLSNL